MAEPPRTAASPLETAIGVSEKVVSPGVRSVASRHSTLPLLITGPRRSLGNLQSPNEAPGQLLVCPRSRRSVLAEAISKQAPRDLLPLCGSSAGSELSVLRRAGKSRSIPAPSGRRASVQSEAPRMRRASVQSEAPILRLASVQSEAPPCASSAIGVRLPRRTPLPPHARPRLRSSSTSSVGGAYMATGLMERFAKKLAAGRMKIRFRLTFVYQRRQIRTI